MNIAAYAYKFFVFSGALLLAIAALQILLLRRERDRAAAARLFTATMVRVVLFVTFGVLSILVGARVIPIGDRPSAPRPNDGFSGPPSGDSAAGRPVRHDLHAPSTAITGR